MFSRLSRLGVLGMSSVTLGGTVSLTLVNRRVTAQSSTADVKSSSQSSRLNPSAASSSSSSVSAITRADEIDIKSLSLPDEPVMKPKLSLWEQYLKNKPIGNSGGKSGTPTGVSKSRWKTLSANAQFQRVSCQRVSHLTVNQYAANTPIEDRYAVRTELETEGLSGMLFGVFDGHSGSNTSEFCKRELFDFIEWTAATTAKFDACGEGEEYYTLHGLTEKMSEPGSWLEKSQYSP